MLYPSLQISISGTLPSLLFSSPLPSPFHQRHSLLITSSPLSISFLPLPLWFLFHSASYSSFATTHFDRSLVWFLLWHDSAVWSFFILRWQCLFIFLSQDFGGNFTCPFLSYLLLKIGFLIMRMWCLHVILVIRLLAIRVHNSVVEISEW